MWKPSKYGNKKVTIGGEKFDSQKEAWRYGELVLLERAGQIYSLNRQVRFELIPAQYIGKKCVERAVHYVADFVYWKDGIKIVEDTKGVRTKDYIIKRKLMLFVHGIRIKEV